MIELDNGARRRGRSTCSRRSPASIVHRATVLARRGDASGARRQAAGRHRAPHGRSPARTPRPTWCTRRSARRSARPRPRRARRTRPGRFRFDFSATGAVPASVMADVEARVNDLLLADLDGARRDHDARTRRATPGAMALFGEKYGDEVRVVSVGDWARELCGGTHAQRSGQLGVVKLLGESSIGSGVRRVEALVGADAYRFLAREHVLVAQLTEALKVRPEELPERVASLVGAAARRREGDRAGPRRQQVLAAAGRARGAAPRTSSASPSSATGAGRHRRRRPAHAGARRPRPDPGRPARPSWSVVGGRQRAARWSSSPSTTRAAQWGIKAGELVRTAAPGARRRRRRQGRRRPGRRHRPLTHRRGAEPDRARRGPARHRQ